jgi:serine/threonine-protein kinase
MVAALVGSAAAGVVAVRLLDSTLAGGPATGGSPSRHRATEAAGRPPAPPSTAAGSPSSSRGPAISLTAAPFAVRASARIRLPIDAAFGPWSCTDTYVWDVGHPVIARPCFATGPAVRVLGAMQALPGVQADVTITVNDADTDSPVGAANTCAAVMFTDFAPEHICGPFDLALERGHRYLVVERWSYTGRDFLPGGTVRGDPFTW